MNDPVEIRESLPNDVAAIEDLYPRAFPDEDLIPLVRALLREKSGVLSLVAIAEAAVAGHVVFTTCGVVGRSERVALLGPLAVAPDRQRRGIGGALVRAGLGRQETDGVERVYVLGDPAYYGRFGFAPDDGAAPPYPLPDAWRGAWQSLRPGGGAPPLQGVLSVPRPWRRRALWAP
jgi:putative acetyltransferase